VAVSWVAAIRVPQSPLFGFLADYVRWLWPIGVFATMAAVIAAFCVLEPLLPGTTRGRGSVLGAFAVAIAFAMATPDGPGAARSRESAAALDTVNLLNDLGVEALRNRPAVFDPRAPNYPIFGFPLVAALNERDEVFYVTDPISIRQFGDGRMPTDIQELPTFYIPVGWEALLSRDDAAAFASTMAADDLDRLGELLPAFVGGFEDGSISLTDDGRALATSAYGRPWMTTLMNDGQLSRTEVFSNFETIMALLDNGMLELPQELEPDRREFVDLSRDTNLRIASVMWR
jgi:hypothetical protein